MSYATPEMTGYDTADRYFATRYTQGGRKVYSIELSLASVGATLPKPDPDRPTPGNRRVKASHAAGFATYVREQEQWVAPSLILRAPDIFTFDPIPNIPQIPGTEFGVLGIPRLARTDLRILDGQHRILGLHIAIEDMARDLERQRQLLSQARQQGDDPTHTRQFEQAIAKIERQRQRFETERIAVEIQVEDDQARFMQMFVDIADNALGITSAIRARFDNRKVVNRCLDDVLRHSLLQDRIDLEQDRISIASPYLLGAKHVADIIRILAVGISGRIGRRQETELQENALVQKSNDFLDALVSGFPILEKLVDGEVTPEEVRRSTLLGSTTMLRALAGAYYELSRDLSDDDIVEYFAKLDSIMGAPVTEASPWLDTGAFEEGMSAPQARRQQVEAVVDAIVRWQGTNPGWLTEAA